MRALIVLAIVAAGTGCLRRTSYEACKADADCAAAGAGARCEPDGACSVADDSCPSGHRYHASSPHAGECVAGGGAVDARPVFAGRECVAGRARPASYSECAALVDAKEPRCGTEQWTPLCVRWVETLCQRSCTGIAFVGGLTHAAIIDLNTHAVLWNDAQNQDQDTDSGAWADFDDDGDADLATVGQTQIHIYREIGGGGAVELEQVYGNTWAVILPGADQLDGRAVDFVDWDGDGDLDVAALGSSGLVLIENQGGGVFGGERVIFHDAPPGPDAAPGPTEDAHAMAWADADGDGDLDLAIGYGAANGSFWVNQGHGQLARGTWNGPNQVSSLEWCNVDTDPLPELVIAGNAYVSITDNITGHPLDDNQAVHFSPGSEPMAARCGDLDGDGDLDVFAPGWHIATRAYRHGAATVNGFAEAWTDATTTMPEAWDVALGDLDGDHRLDALASGHGYVGPLRVQPYLGASSGGSFTFTKPAPIDVPAVDHASFNIALAPAP